jgi:hypothetical protein
VVSRFLGRGDPCTQCFIFAGLQRFGTLVV